VRASVRQGRLFVAREGGRIVACLRLATKKPWAIDRAYFTDVARPLYLVEMAVHPAAQRRGVGRACLAAADVLARESAAGAIRLDAYDGAGGAGPFYERCGYAERGRVTYRSVPLIYYERLL